MWNSIVDIYDVVNFYCLHKFCIKLEIFVIAHASLQSEDYIVIKIFEVSYSLYSSEKETILTHSIIWRQVRTIVTLLNI